MAVVASSTMSSLFVLGVFMLTNSVSAACVNTPFWRKEVWLANKSTARIKAVFHNSAKHGVDLWQQLPFVCRAVVVCLPGERTQLPYTLTKNRKLHLEAYPKSEPKFTIALKRGNDVPLTFEGCFHCRRISKTVFLKSRRNNMWSRAVKSKHFPFQQLSYFTMTVERSPTSYIVEVKGVSGSCMWHYKDKYRNMHPHTLEFTDLHIFSLQVA
ncbi:uncharacterized protein [Haliotis cracherodii]